MRIHTSGLLAVLGAALLLSATPAGAAPRGGITLYQEDDFDGDSRDIRGDSPDLGWLRFDDRVSSVEVRRGVWELCEHSNYRGRCITVDEDVPRLDRLHFDDRVSSVRRIR